MAVFDATFLIALVDPKAKVAIDPVASKPVELVQARNQNLLKELDERGEFIIIPVPALSSQ